MAKKAKKLETGYGRDVEETSRGILHWSTGACGWFYTERPGFNLYVAVDGAELSLAHVTNLIAAGLVAEGFEAGLEHGRSMGAAAQPAAPGQG